MNQDNENREPLEQLGSDFTEGGVAAPADAGPAAAPYAGGPMIVGMAAGPADKQYYQFLWGGIAVLFGCLLPFHRAAAGWVADVFQPELAGPIGVTTVAGSIVAFCAIVTIGAQLYSIKYRKVFLWPIVLMLFVLVWAGLRGLGGFGAEKLGYRFRPAPEEVALWSPEQRQEQEDADFAEKGAKGPASMLYDGAYFVDYWRHVGPGYLFCLGGSGYVVWAFLGALFGIRKPKTGAAGGAASGGEGAPGDRKDRAGSKRGARRR